MAHDNAFVAAYVLLLARLWQEMEHILPCLKTGTALDAVQLRVETFRLDLVLLQQSLKRTRLPLRESECAKICVVIDQLLDRCYVQGPGTEFAVAAIHGAQDLLFDEVYDLVIAAESRPSSETHESVMRDVA
jgi:hypothetical protein